MGLLRGYARNDSCENLLLESIFSMELTNNYPNDAKIESNTDTADKEVLKDFSNFTSNRSL